ncbi:MalM family protein, partial [Salmonella enterica]|uniref:MalM family protein n=1 Tax=Salmonella enterica TaxID=28901 RepID=UPI00398C6B2A
FKKPKTLLDPAKAYAKGVGNSIPDSPDPVARHTTDGVMKLKVTTNSSASVLVGPLFGSSGTGPVPVGNTAAPVAAPAPVAAKKSVPTFIDPEGYFNKAIKAACSTGDVDKAQKRTYAAVPRVAQLARSTCRL